MNRCPRPPVALTVAGSDPSGGAGIQADLRTFQRHGVHGTSVLTLLTVQGPCGVERVQRLDPGFVVAQLRTLLRDLPPAAAKTGALGSAAVAAALAEEARHLSFPLVVDPVRASSDGTSFLDGEALEAVRERLLPLAFLATPNLDEAAALTGLEVRDPNAMERAAAAIGRLGARHVLVTGGHLEGEPIDVLWSAGRARRLPGTRIAAPNTHGTGCVLSAAVTARLARGEDLAAAVAGARAFVAAALDAGRGQGGGLDLRVPGPGAPPAPPSS